MRRVNEAAMTEVLIINEVGLAVTETRCFKNSRSSLKSHYSNPLYLQLRVIAADNPTAQRHADSRRVMRQRDLSGAFPRGRPCLLENRVMTATMAAGKAKQKL
jgi:hypothetical protein